MPTRITMTAFLQLLFIVASFPVLRAQDFSFEPLFWSYAMSIQNAIQSRTQNLDLALLSLSQTITLHVTNNEMTFPYVTLPNFEVLGQQAQSQSGAESIFFLPLVNEESQEAWGVYSTEFQDWLGESRNFLLVNPNEFIFDESPISSDIYSMDNPTEPISIPQGGIAFPIWQTSPPPLGPFPVNLDFNTSMDSFTELVRAATELQTGVVTEAMDSSTLLSSSLANYRPMETPLLQVVYPVFDALPVVPDTSQATAIIVALVGVESYLEGILPGNDADGIVAVFYNSCGHIRSFQINGPQSSYLGLGDLHDTAYDEFVIEIPFQFFNVSQADLERFSQCSDYSLKIYPSKEFELQFQPTAAPTASPEPTSTLAGTDPTQSPIPVNAPQAATPASVGHRIVAMTATTWSIGGAMLWAIWC